MRGRFRYAISSTAKRFGLRPVTFTDNDTQFVVVYANELDGSPPLLQWQDFLPAVEYLEIPPPPKYQRRSRQTFESRATNEFEFDATPIALTENYDKWRLGPGQESHRDEAEESGYECEFADCHQHILEVKDITQTPTPYVPIVSEGLLRWQNLPNGYLFVFASPSNLDEFLLAHKISDSRTDAQEVRLQLSEEVTAVGVRLSWYQRRQSRAKVDLRAIQTALQRR
eukprot:c9727_g1_i2.p1 GENE.c9727_g1_i2~~c9727_g1_i2.p1  ORF type:complete len:226 (+),score=55.67 c9727_g1_i2:896-1573(+)